MARYTMLFKDFIEAGGQYPACFAEIEGLQDAFYGRYCVSEIGFETPSIFQIRLEAKANELVPFYKEKMTLASAQYVGMLTPSKIETITHEYGEAHTLTKGESLDLPTDAEAFADPTTKTKSDATTDERTDTDTRETGLSALERLEVLQKLNEIKKPILSKLLDEFKDLFMEVYY